eukprot:g27796.t1
MEDMFGGDVLLDLSEMVENDPLNVEAGGMKSENKGNLITISPIGIIVRHLESSRQEESVGKTRMKMNSRGTSQCCIHGGYTLSDPVNEIPEEIQHSNFCLPTYGKDIIQLERVQKRLNSMLSGIEGLRYKERLDRLG